MAIYHLRLKVLSRALGRAAKPGGASRRSAIAAAAYRSGQRLYDDAQGRWFQFDKPDVVHTEILAPAGAPAWVFDRQTLWNLVERAEKRMDAQLAREVELSLPRELSREEQIALVRGFVREHFVSQGMIADVGIHCPDAADGQEQPHAHVMLTLRQLDPEGPFGFSARKERDWNEREDVAHAVAEARKRFNDTGLPEDKDALDAAEATRNVKGCRSGRRVCVVLASLFRCNRERTFQFVTRTYDRPISRRKLGAPVRSKAGGVFQLFLAQAYG